VPEGDTIFRAARTLHAALAGRTVTRFASSLPRVAAGRAHHRIEGRTVSAVEARGKHLIVRFEGGPSLHTHMRMTGSWHLYRAGHALAQECRHRAAVVETGDRVAVCFAAPVVEWLTPAQEAAHDPLTSLGPDLLSSGFDAAGARANLRARGAQEIGAALMGPARARGHRQRLQVRDALPVRGRPVRARRGARRRDARPSDRDRRPRDEAERRPSAGLRRTREGRSACGSTAARAKPVSAAAPSSG
jgi:hypothetical protein